MNKIEREQYELAYRLGRQVYEGKMRLTEARDEVAGAGVNENSAVDLISDLRHMLDGKLYKRALSTGTTDDFLTWIRRDYGDAVFAKAVYAVEQHLDYYTGLKGAPMQSHRKILAKHSALVESSGITTFHSPEELSKDTTYREGAVRQVTVNAYERNPAARAACIAHFGCSCSVCGFDFGAVYGDLGKGFIHVHHLKEISTVEEEYKVDPIQDLRPVCPNCHAMLHKRNPAYTIDELRKVLNSDKAKV